jgi:hypothetical protein
MKNYLPVSTLRSARSPNAAIRRTVDPGRTSRSSLPGGEMRAAGKPLDGTIRSFMEPRFGHDFSGVRVHTDADAASSARAIGAVSYTAGTNLVFARGAYAPETPEGRGLLAHELAHVVQQRSGRTDPHAVSRPGDADETGAHQAVSEIAMGRSPRFGPARAGVQRQLADAPPVLLPKGPISPQQSQAELVLESFLNRMWDAQSKQQQPFRLTPKVIEGLAIIFPLGAPLGAVTDYPSTTPVIERLRSRLPASIDDRTAAVLDRLPQQEKPLARPGPGAAEDAAAPKFPTPGPQPPIVPDPRKPPPRGPGADEAAAKALAAAFAEFQRTKLGKELEQAAKRYVFSKEGIPLVILVVGGLATFVAANDPKLPATPDIPLASGIKLKVELSRASDVPPLLHDIIHDSTEPPGTPERKVGVTATFTFEALGEATNAVGHFFAEAAGWITSGVVKAGTVVGGAARSVLPELAGAALGATTGAIIGGAVGGGLGAGIGALAGAGIGAGAALIERWLTDR